MRTIDVFIRTGTDQWMGQWLFMEIWLTGVWTAVNDGPEHSDQETRHDDHSHSHSGRAFPRSVRTCRNIRRKGSVCPSFLFELRLERSFKSFHIIIFHIWLLQQFKDNDIFSRNKLFILFIYSSYFPLLSDGIPGKWMFFKAADNLWRKPAES